MVASISALERKRNRTDTSVRTYFDIGASLDLVLSCTETNVIAHNVRISVVKWNVSTNKCRVVMPNVNTALKRAAKFS